MRRADAARRDHRSLGIAPALLGWVGVLAVSPTAAGQERSSLDALSSEIRRIARDASPAVVAIRPAVASSIDEGSRPDRGGFGGSGVVIDAGLGLVLTADSVVRAAGTPESLIVVLPDGRRRPVRELRRDPDGDLALLAIDPAGAGLAALDWADSESLRAGDAALAIGQPFGMPGTVSLGIVGGSGGVIASAPDPYPDLIRTDAGTGPGGEGGALVDRHGRLLGILVGPPLDGVNPHRFGFAVPSRRARVIAGELADLGFVRRATIGVEVSDADPGSIASLDLPGAVLIESVAPFGPADEAGILPGDLIAAVDERPCPSVRNFRALVEFAAPGEPLALDLIRDARRHRLIVAPQVRSFGDDIRLGPIASTGPPRQEGPPSGPPAPGTPADPIRLPEPASSRDPTRFPELGLRLDEQSPRLASRFGLEPDVPGVVIVGVTPGGPADLGGLVPGMLITDLLDRRTPSLAAFRRAVATGSRGGDLILRIRHRGRAEFRVILREPPEEGARTPSAPGT